MVPNKQPGDGDDDAKVQLRASPFGAGPPVIPTAKTATLARIASPASMDRSHQKSFLQSLKRYFAGTKRIVKKGDLIAVGISTEPVFDVVDDEDAKEDPNSTVIECVVPHSLFLSCCNHVRLQSSRERGRSARLSRVLRSDKLGIRRAFSSGRTNILRFFPPSGHGRARVLGGPIRHPDGADWSGAFFSPGHDEFRRSWYVSPLSLKGETKHLNRNRYFGIILDILDFCPSEFPMKNSVAYTKLHDFVNAPLRENAADYGLELSVLLSGALGSGLTELATHVARSIGYHSLEVSFHLFFCL